MIVRADPENIVSRSTSANRHAVSLHRQVKKYPPDLAGTSSIFEAAVSAACTEWCLLFAFEQAFRNIQINTDEAVEQFFRGIGQTLAGLFVDKNTEAHQVGLQLFR